MGNEEWHLSVFDWKVLWRLSRFMLNKNINRMGVIFMKNILKENQIIIGAIIIAISIIIAANILSNAILIKNF